MGAITAIVSVVIGFLLGSMIALPYGFLFINTQPLQKWGLTSLNSHYRQRESNTKC